MILLAMVGGALVVVLLMVGATTVLNWVLRKKEEAETDGDI